MFDAELLFRVERVGLKTVPDGPTVRRRMRFALVREFDAVIAGALDGGRDVRAGLTDHALLKATMPIDGLALSAKLVSGGSFGDGVPADGKASSVDLRLVEGVRADAVAAKASDDEREDEPPGITLWLDAGYSDEAWLFLGRNLGAYVRVTLSRVQQELPGVGRAAAGAPKPARQRRPVERDDDDKVDARQPPTEEPAAPPAPPEPPRLRAPKRMRTKLEDAIDMGDRKISVEMLLGPGDIWHATAIDTPGPIVASGGTQEQAMERLRAAVERALEGPSEESAAAS